MNTDYGRSKMGYAFVEFYNTRSVVYVKKVMNGLKIFGQRIIVRGANNKGSSNEGDLYCKHFPYEMSEDDLFEVFGKFGEVSSLRITRITSPGMCFVTMASAEGADSAIQSLHGRIFGNERVIVKLSDRAKEARGTTEGPASFANDHNEIFLRPLPSNSNNLEVEELFSAYGKVQ
jgi:RNA recognition motif-containing protein